MNAASYKKKDNGDLRTSDSSIVLIAELRLVSHMEKMNFLTTDNDWGLKRLG